MKLRNKLAAIAAAAMLAFTGVGFAAWTFTKSVDADVTVTDKVAVGIELTDDLALHNASGDAQVTALYLICDAPAGNSNVLAGAGVYWATDAAGANAITNVYLKGTVTKDNEDGVLDNKATVTIAFEADYSALSSTYIDFGAAPAISDVSNVSTVNGTEYQSGNFALPSVDYLIVPTSISELTDMNTALATDLASAALSFSAHIKA